MKVFFAILLLFVITQAVSAVGSNFQATTNIVIADVIFGVNSADLLIKADSQAESFTYNNGIFSVTNPSTDNIFKVGSLDSEAKAIRLLNSSSELIGCIKNNNLGEDFISLPTANGTYYVEPSNINLSNSLSYNSQCGASSCVSGYVISGSGSSAICVSQPSGGGSGSSGGGGGGATALTCSSVEYGPWQNCVGGIQIRSVISSLPNSCTLTTAQQLAANRTCVINGETALNEELSENQRQDNNNEEAKDPVVVKGGNDLKQEVLKREKENQASQVNITLTSRLAGRILLQVEEKGEAWYIDPRSRERSFLGRPTDAFDVMRQKGIGATNQDLNKIPISLDNLSGLDSDGDELPDNFEIAVGTNPNNSDSDGDGHNDYIELLNNYNPLSADKLSYNLNFTKAQAGKILLQVEKNGEAWYINPENTKRYFLGRPDDAFRIMRELALGITNNNLRQIPLRLDD